MLHLMMPHELKQTVTKAGSRIERQLKKQTGSANVKRVAGAVSEISKATERYRRGRALFQDWSSAALVTIVQAYLEDGLTLLSTKIASLLGNEIALQHDLILNAQSIDDLRSEVRRQWAAKATLGGPNKWLPMLQKLGARRYSKDCAFRLRHLWDTRKSPRDASQVT